MSDLTLGSSCCNRGVHGTEVWWHRIGKFCLKTKTTFMLSNISNYYKRFEKTNLPWRHKLCTCQIRIHHTLANITKCYYEHMSQDNSVGIVMGYKLDGQGSIPSRDKRFFSSPVSRPALGPTQPPVRWVWGALSLGGKAAGAWNWPLRSNAEVKNGGAIPPPPHTPSW
jgi:hypothetical protein